MQILRDALANGTEIGTLLLGVTAILTFIFLIFRGRSWYESSHMKVAEQSILLQRQEHQRKFEFDVAVEAVDLFNNLKVDFDIIRSPAVYEDEIKELENLEEINDLVKKMKSHKDGGIILMRFDKREETRVSINRLRPKFNAVFGDTAPFDAAISIYKHILISAWALTEDLTGESSGKYKNIIWNSGENDKISLEIKKVVQDIEDLCIPVIRGDTIK